MKLESIIEKSNFWTAKHRKHFMCVYALEFDIHHKLVAKMATLPHEVDKHIVEGCKRHPEQFSDASMSLFISALIERKRYALVLKMMDMKLGYNSPVNHRNQASDLHEFTIRIDWDNLGDDIILQFAEVYAKHEGVVSAAIVAASDDEQRRHWASGYHAKLITKLYQTGTTKIAEALFHLTCKNYWSDDLVRHMIKERIFPDISACEANVKLAYKQNNPYYVSAMIELHLASSGYFPLLVDAGHKSLEGYGKRMNSIICDHGGGAPELAGEIALRYLEGCPKATAFFYKPFPVKVVERHPALIEGAFQADLGL
jgi:hypothetical protein